MSRLLFVWIPVSLGVASAEEADLILHGGKVVTVDDEFSVQQALAVRGDRILVVGSDEVVLRTKGGSTRMVALEGRTVLPGMIDSHVHPGGASMHEFDHEIPPMETIDDVLRYLRGRVESVEDGAWIQVRQVFITRLRERRYPTKAELDGVAPKNPVVFSTGPDASLNTLALERSGIDKDFEVSDGGPGYVEKDPATGEPTGILRSCTRYIKSESSGREATEEDRYRRLLELVKDYNASGLTSIADRAARPADIERYKKMLDRGDLTVRVFASHRIETLGPIEKVVERVKDVARHPLRSGNSMLRVGGVKVFLDGGMLTGSAYMREPWGVSEIYSIDDPAYRGVLFIPRERLLPIVKAAVESGLQFTAHSVGDGAVHALLDVYEEVGKTLPLGKTRPCITHSNFMSLETVRKLPELGVCVDIQPAWLYLDASTLVRQFGYERLRYFQPLKSIFEARGIAGGGSDHMQKIGSMRAVNPYNPFFGMWITMARRARWYEGRLHPEEALDREQAVRFYTVNNAHLLFQEKTTGSLEAGKFADLIVVDRDILACPLDEVAGTKVLRTYLAGKLVYSLKP